VANAESFADWPRSALAGIAPKSWNGTRRYRRAETLAAQGI
jgi:hypothetical protein